MFKKKKVREDFDQIYKSGNEEQIKKMLDENPWLLEEVSQDMDQVMGDQKQIIAALGVMEDELGGPVPNDEIVFSLRVDFNIRKTDAEIATVLKDIEGLGLAKKEGNGWILTNEGGRVCDNYLNKHLEEIAL